MIYPYISRKLQLANPHETGLDAGVYLEKMQYHQCYDRRVFYLGYDRRKRRNLFSCTVYGCVLLLRSRTKGNGPHATATATLLHGTTINHQHFNIGQLTMPPANSPLLSGMLACFIFMANSSNSFPVLSLFSMSAIPSPILYYITEKSSFIQENRG